jgi:hypothetical protein
LQGNRAAFSARHVAATTSPFTPLAWLAWLLGVLVAAGGPVNAKPQLVHVALLDIIKAVLVGAVQVVAA